MTRIAPGTDAVARRMAASAEDVFRALIDPDALVRWLPPEGATGTLLRFEAVPGGPWEMALRFAGGGEDVVRGRFVEIDPPRRLVQEARLETADPSRSGTMRLVWEVAPAPVGCEIRVTAEGVPEGIGEADHHAGLTSSLASLATLVESRPAGGPRKDREMES